MNEDSLETVFRRGAAVLAALSDEGVPAPWVSFADVAPTLGHEVGHAFGAIIARSGLDLRTREITTVCMLATLGGSEPQVAFHVGGALRAGASAPEIVEALTQVSVYAGVPRALNALAAARPVFVRRGADPLAPAPRAVVVDFLDALAIGDCVAAGLLADELGCWSLSGRTRLTAAGSRVACQEWMTHVSGLLAGGGLTLREPLPGGASVYVPGEGAEGEVVLAFDVAGGRIKQGRVLSS